MIGATIGFYLLVLIGGLVLTGSDALGWPQLIGVALIAVIATVVFEGLSMLLGDWDAEREEDDRRLIGDYLGTHHVAFSRRLHHRTVGARRLAECLDVSADVVGKVMMVRADGEAWMAVLPASERVDFAALADALHAREVVMMTEDEFAPMFPGCEVGSEPPFGHLYGLPVIADSPLMSEDLVVFRAGSHNAALAMPVAEFERLEHPVVASFGVRVC